jgi:hypothetical protein
MRRENVTTNKQSMGDAVPALMLPFVYQYFDTFGVIAGNVAAVPM